MTWMAEAACDSFSGRLETDVTSRFISCSSVSFLSARGDAAESGCWAKAWWARITRPRARSVTTGGRRQARATRRLAPRRGPTGAENSTTKSPPHISTPLPSTERICLCRTVPWCVLRHNRCDPPPGTALAERFWDQCQGNHRVFLRQKGGFFRKDYTD